MSKAWLAPPCVPDLFDPRCNPLPAVFPLPAHANPLASEGVEFFPIPLYTNLVPNMKVIVAKGMLDAACASGQLEGVHTIVEGTSGNTGAGEGILAPYYGIKRVVAVVERDTAPGKREQLRFFGVEDVVPDLDRGLSTVEEARYLGQQPGWLNLGQYENEANPKAHEMVTGPYVLEQTKGRVDIFCAGLGTTGTIVGTSRYLRRMKKGVTIVGGIVAEDSAVPGVRNAKKLEQVGFDWRNAIDDYRLVETKPSYLRSRQLCLAGRMVGPSGGFAFEAAIRYVTDNLSRLKRGSDGKLVVAFICGDSPLPYMDKYSTILDPGDLLPLSPVE